MPMPLVHFMLRVHARRSIEGFGCLVLWFPTDLSLFLDYWLVVVVASEDKNVTIFDNLCCGAEEVELNYIHTMCLHPKDNGSPRQRRLVLSSTQDAKQHPRGELA